MTYKHQSVAELPFPAQSEPLTLSIEEEDENGAYDAEEDQRRFEEAEEQWLYQQENS